MASSSCRHLQCRWLTAGLVALFAECGGLLGRTLAEAKVQVGSVRIGGANTADQWQYIGKFGYGLGEGDYSIRLRLPLDAGGGGGLDVVNNHSRAWRRPMSLDLELFLDEEWPNVENIAPCQRASEVPARRTLSVDLLRDRGEWGTVVTGQLIHVMRPHIWYFALSDCAGELGNETVDVEFDFQTRQQDGSEFSVESRHMPVAEGLALLGLSAFLVRTARRCSDVQQSAGGLHPVVWALAAAVVLRYASHVSNLVHLLKYRSDGVGLHSFDALAEVLFMMSQVVHATLLIAIAKGYTLLPTKDCEPELMRFALIATMAAHTALVCFGKLQEGTAPDRHHENDGAAGWTIVAIRIVLFAWFVLAVRSTQERAGYMLKDFLQRFRLAGSLYFLAYPLVFLIAQCFAPYLRHPIMVVGLLIAQAGADLWLADLFLARGAYFKVSALNVSLLPGGADSVSWTTGPLWTSLDKGI